MAILENPVSQEKYGWNAEHPAMARGSADLAVAPWDATACAKSIAYQIGGISFALFPEGDVQLTLDPALRDFAIYPPKKRTSCDVNLSVSLVDSLPSPQREPLFDSGGLWSLFEERLGQRDGYRLNFQRSFPGESPYKSAWLDREFRTGHLSLSRLFFTDDRPIYPLEYPLDEVLMIHHLACGHGLEVHAVGVVEENGRGHLFLGHSGAGKSTTARLWLKQPGVRILSDDRIVLRSRGGKIWMYGTPWHGDAGISSPHAAPVSNIYFLEQYGSNEIVPIAPGVACAELFARSFVPRHGSQGLDFALSFIERVAREIPCNIFRFLPQQSAVEVIRHARD
jgi:hypothetical protein